MKDRFEDHFVKVFRASFPKVFRYLDRQCGDPELAEDVAQDAFVRLYQRGSLPDAPEAWLISVANNLFRNARWKQSRRRRLLTLERGTRVLSDPPPTPAERSEAGAHRDRVRVALDRLSERDRQLLLLRAEGYSYREIAQSLELNEASVGTLLARAKRAFLAVYEESSRAS